MTYAHQENSINQKNKKKKKKKSSGLFIAIFVFLIVMISAVYIAIHKYMPNYNMVDPYEFFETLKKDDINIILNDKLIKLNNKPVKTDEDIYIPVDFIKEYIDKYIFWDNKANRLTVTTEDKVIQMRTEELAYYINHEAFSLNIPVNKINDIAYMPVKMLMELYEVSIEFSERYNLLIIDYTYDDKEIYKVSSKKTNMRYEPSNKSPIAEKLEVNTKLIGYGTENSYTKIRTEDGLIGYIKSDDLKHQQTIAGNEREPVVSKNPEKMEDIKGKINVVWDQVTTVEANYNQNRRIAHKGLDVLSPTWFSFDDEKMNGDIINIADKNYVDWAHSNGYQVWALITDNFNGDVAHAILSDTNTREYVEKQLLTFVSMYNLDGINIDFEMVRETDVEYFLQFLRELYPLLKQQGVILSVDVYVPKAFNLYYNRTEIAKASDYLIIMAYDEHHATSPVSGPVASIGFVEEGIQETLKETTKDKIILGIPYYVRVWREVDSNGTTNVSSRAYSMEVAYKMFIDNRAEFKWDVETASHYAEYTTEEDNQDVTYKVWLEDERSIEEKLKLVRKYDLAGVAGWKRGLEKDVIWELVNEHLKKE